MSKPEDVTDEAWEAADPVMEWIDAFWADELTDSEKDEARECIAGAIMAAEKRGEEREREACALEVDELRRLLHQQHEVLDIGREDSAFTIAAAAVRKRGVA